MSEFNSPNYQMAVRDFQRARKAAVMQQFLAKIRGQNKELLDYERVSNQLQASDYSIQRGLQEIPLDKIIGSVGRYRDFTREFLPINTNNETRWANVRTAMEKMSGMPPILVYQMGDAYFVIDGNHRVSVARQLGTKTISAYVTEIETRVPLSAEDDYNSVICKAQYAKFLQNTNLDNLHPEADLMMTVCGHYRHFLEQIEVQRQLLAENTEVDLEQIPLETAVSTWYKAVYLPVVEIIREMGIMRRFPDRTEADIYELLSQHRQEMESALGWQIELEADVPELVAEQTKSTRPILNRMVEAILPELGTAEPVGAWREQQLAMHREHRLFSDYLILFEGIEEDWDLLDTAIKLALADKDRLLALYVVATESEQNSEATVAMRERFMKTCHEAGLVGEFAVEAGNFLNVILKRAAWSDMVFINLTHPPDSTVLGRLRSSWGALIERCPRPMMVIPHGKFNGETPMLLPYDGSLKADEALFIATYNRVRWGHSLTVLTVETPNTPASALDRAKEYIEQFDVDDVNYVLKSGDVGKAIIETANEQGCNLIVMGGFGLRPMMRLMLGSSVEYVLQHATQSILICR